MGIEIVPYAPEHVDRVVAFNRRLRAGGFRAGWYEACEDDWLPRRPGVPVWREHYVAVENGAEIRGAYALKPQPWWIRDRFVTVTDWQGPVSEGVVDARYAPLGLRFFRDMQKRQPLLYSWGHGGEEARMLQLLRSMKWHFHATPFCLRVARPFPFLRESALSAQHARTAARPRPARLERARMARPPRPLRTRCRCAASRSGRPRAGTSTSRPSTSSGRGRTRSGRSALGAYQAIGLRDARTMNALLPRGEWPPGIRLRVRRGERTLGWAVGDGQRAPGERPLREHARRERDRLSRAARRGGRRDPGCDRLPARRGAST